MSVSDYFTKTTLMGDHKIMVADYFQESTYQDEQGKPRKCYFVTKIPQYVGER